MLARKNRLTAEDFFSGSEKTVRGEGIVVRVRLNSLSRNRFAVVISSKTEPSAVIRHRIKRKIFTTAAEWGGSGLDVVFVCTKKVGPTAEKGLSDEIPLLLTKVSNLARSRKND